MELNIHIKDGAIVKDGLQYVINAWDENAVEAAVQLKENHGAETTLVTIGSGDAGDIIRKCYAMGIEKGIHIDDPSLDRADSSVFARVIQKVYEQSAYDLVILGKQAQDTDSGQTGIMLAEYLELPCVSNVISIEVMDERHIQASRLGDTGTEIVELELPAVVTVSDSINEPRLPAMRGIMMAKKRKIDVLNLAALGTTADEVGTGDLKTEIIEYAPSQKRVAGQKFEGDPAEITARVVDLLTNEANVI